MMKRRSFLVLAAVATLAACAEPGQLLDSGVASSLRVTEVTASTTVKRTETAVPKDQIVEAARSRVAAALGPANPNGKRPVRAEVKVTGFYIANAIAGVLLGSNTSVINTEITLVDVATGAVVQPPFKINGSTEARPTIIGAAAIKAPAQELAIITNDLAAKTRVAVYGK